MFISLGIKLTPSGKKKKSYESKKTYECKNGPNSKWKGPKEQAQFTVIIV